MNTDRIVPTKEELIAAAARLTKNIIHTDAGYMAEGFTAEEVPMIRRHDILFNKGDSRTDAETEEMFRLIKKLGL